MIVMIIFVPSFDEFVGRFFCISFMCFMISGNSCDLLGLNSNTKGWSSLP